MSRSAVSPNRGRRCENAPHDRRPRGLGPAAWLPVFPCRACAGNARQGGDAFRWQAARSLNHSSSSAYVSGSAAMPALMAASSPYSLSISSKVIPLNSSLVIIPFLSRIGLSQADDADFVPAPGKDNDIEATANISSGDKALLIMLLSGDGCGPVEIVKGYEVNAMFFLVATTLRLVLFLVHALTVAMI